MKPPTTPRVFILAALALAVAPPGARACMRMADGSLMGCRPGETPPENRPSPPIQAFSRPAPQPGGDRGAPGPVAPPVFSDDDGDKGDTLGLTDEQQRAVEKEFPGSTKQMHKKAHELAEVIDANVARKDMPADEGLRDKEAIEAGIKTIAGDAARYVQDKSIWDFLHPGKRQAEIQELKNGLDQVVGQFDAIKFKGFDPDGDGKLDSVHDAFMGDDGGMTTIMTKIDDMVKNGGFNGGGQGGGPRGGGQERGGGAGSSHLQDNADKNPDLPRAQTMAAEDLLQNGNASAAMPYINKALAVDPQNERALSDLAVAQYQLNNPSDASQAAHKALGLNPDDAAAQAVLKFTDGRAGVAGAAGRLSATDLFNMRSNSHEGAISALYGGGVSLPAGAMSNASAAMLRDAIGAISNGAPDRAIRDLDKVLAQNPNNLQALNLRAMALLRQRRYGEALADAEEGLRRSPKNRAFMDTRAAALNKLHRFQEAADQARDALAQNPKDAAAWRALSEALAGLGDRAGSLDALKRAAELDPRFKQTLETALQLPADADLNLLFADDAASAAAARPAPSSVRARQLKRFGLVIGAALAAGLLMVLGLLPALKKQAQAAWTSITRRGPSVGSLPQRRATDLIKGQYQPIRQIGFGGMGMVFEGLDVNLQRPVAIKKMRDEIKSDARERARFVQEAKLVAALHHPSVVDIYAIAEEGSDVFLVFEYIKGGTLYDHVVARGRLPLDEAVKILEGVVDGLEYAHGRGIIHRDLKPSNIMLTEDGRVKVMDFGIARVAKDALTRASQVMTNTIVGTPPYMAPEQEQGLVRKESDTYALALCLYEMLTGRMAFAGTGAGMLMSKINKAYAPATALAPELPVSMDAVFAAALEPEPSKRLATPRELLERVKAAAGSRKT